MKLKNPKKNEKYLKRRSVYIKDGLEQWMKKSRFIKRRLKGVDMPTKKILEGLPDSDDSDAQDIVLNSGPTQRAG